MLIKGELPSPINPPTSCAFDPRCPHTNQRCRDEMPELQPFEGSEHFHACHAVAEGRLPDLPNSSS